MAKLATVNLTTFDQEFPGEFGEESTTGERREKGVKITKKRPIRVAVATDSTVCR